MALMTRHVPQTTAINGSNLFARVVDVRFCVVIHILWDLNIHVASVVLSTLVN